MWLRPGAVNCFGRFARVRSGSRRDNEDLRREVLYLSLEVVERIKRLQNSLWVDQPDRWEGIDAECTNQRAHPTFAVPAYGNLKVILGQKLGHRCAFNIQADENQLCFFVKRGHRALRFFYNPERRLRKG